MRKWVWLIAGGLLQMPMAHEIKRRGYALFLTDGNPKAHVRSLADSFVELDTYDVQGHVALAQKLDFPVRAVLTAGADVGPTVSAVAETLGLPAVAFDVAERVRDKIAMRARLLTLHDHPVFVFLSEDGISSASIVWQSVCAGRCEPYPCVVKPRDNCASRGLTVVRGAKELPAAVRKAIAFNKAVDVPMVIIEEYLEAEEEVALDFFVEEGQVHFANAALRLWHAPSLEAGHINPWFPSQEVLDLAQRVAMMLGVDWGPFKMDVLRHPEYGWCVLECATRLSGGFDHMFTCPIATGKDVTGAMLDGALGFPLDPAKLLPRWMSYACAYAPILKPGRVRQWTLPAVPFGVGEGGMVFSVRRIEGLEGLKYLFVMHSRDIPPLEHCAARPLFIITEGNTQIQAWDRAIEVSERVEVTYDD